MNRKYSFWLYAGMTALLLFLARHHWTELRPAAKLWQVNFAWQFRSLRVSLLCVNTLLFDCLSVLLLRLELRSIGTFLAIRQPKISAVIKNIMPQILVYFGPFILVHLINFTGTNIMFSVLALVVMSVIWFILVLFSKYLWPVLVQMGLVFLVFLSIRLLCSLLNVA